MNNKMDRIVSVWRLCTSENKGESDAAYARLEVMLRKYGVTMEQVHQHAKPPEAQKEVFYHHAVNKDVAFVGDDDKFTQSNWIPDIFFKKRIK